MAPIISQSKAMQRVFDVIAKVAQSSSSVLITGESGTGKELIAQAIHHDSLRAHKPFVAINCASIPAELIESELFGYEKGAFTGAAQRTTGKFEYAHGGTLFLDEVSTLKVELQAKLLRFLQEREFSKVGGHRTVRVDVRVIAATNMQLPAMVRQGDFREDLYFRLNVIPIDVPPLRQRAGDIPILVDFFLKKFNRLLQKNIPAITSAALKVLEDYPWPGNIRELENLIERMVVLSSSEQPIDERDLPFDLFFYEEDKLSPVGPGGDEGGLLQARREFEHRYILKVLKTCGGNQTETAAALKIHRNTLLNKIKALKINLPAMP